MSIFEVRHQRAAQQVLRCALACRRMPHAYLFHGPEGVGREMLAVRLARLLLCERPVEIAQAPIPELAELEGPWRDACGECRDCVMSRAGTHPDLHLVYRELRQQHPDSTVRQRISVELGVDVIRHFLLERVASKPFRGRAKVFIVRGADLLTAEAQNALLKTLEEPPASTFLVLISTGLGDLLATTRSRCQQAPFGPLPARFIAERLAVQCEDLPARDAERYAALAEGSLGEALRMVTDGLGEFHQRVRESLGQIGRGPVLQLSKAWLDEAKELGEISRKRESTISDSEAQRRGLRLLLSMLAAGLDERLRSAAREPRSAAALPSLARAIQTVAETQRYVDQNVNVQLTLDALAIKLARQMERSRSA